MTNQQKLWVYTLTLTCIMLVIAVFPQSLDPLLAYRRDAVLNGQLWRLVSCHFVHLNSYHFLLDGAGFLLITFIFQDLLTPRHLITWLLVSAPLCGLMLLLDPHLYSYVGLSGILHGWLVLALIVGFRDAPKLHAAILAAIVIKLIYEQTSLYNADYLNQLINGYVYPLAHLYGAVIGLALGLYFLLGYRQGANNEVP